MSHNPTPYCYFNPRSPHGERQPERRWCPVCCHFNPRSPHGERRAGKRASSAAARNFNPRSPHGERPVVWRRLLVHRCGISIHAPRTGSDSPRGGRTRRRNGISIHAPRTGSDRVGVAPQVHVHISIHAPRTGSDLSDVAKGRKRPHFNPRSPHGERHPLRGQSVGSMPFQSTLPARGATRPASRKSATLIFQSTLPARGATRMDKSGCRCFCGISIHAPRTGSDPLQIRNAAAKMKISIHAPRTGSDDDILGNGGGNLIFQSTLPARGATMALCCVLRHNKNFNPRSPHGERQSPLGR